MHRNGNDCSKVMVFREGHEVLLYVFFPEIVFAGMPDFRGFADFRGLFFFKVIPVIR